MPPNKKIHIVQGSGKPELELEELTKNEYIIRTVLPGQTKPYKVFFSKINHDINPEEKQTKNKLKIPSKIFKTLKRVIIPSEYGVALTNQIQDIVIDKNNNSNLWQSWDLNINVSHKPPVKKTSNIGCEHKKFEDQSLDGKCMDAYVVEYGDINIAIFYIGGLLLQAKDPEHECHKISGTSYLHLADYYLTQNIPDRYAIIGSLHDAANSHIPGFCSFIDKYYNNNLLSKSEYDYLFNLLRTNYWRPLTTDTIISSGLTFYEKSGYMRIPEPNYTVRQQKQHQLFDNGQPLNYFDAFSIFVDELIRRQEILNMPFKDLNKFIKQKRNQKYSKKYNWSEKITGLVVLHQELKISTPFSAANITNLRTLYTWFSSLNIDEFITGSNGDKKSPPELQKQRLLLYSLLYIDLHGIISDLLALSGERGYEHYKFLRLPATPANSFVLQLHRSIPGIKPELLPTEFTNTTWCPSTAPANSTTNRIINKLVCKSISPAQKLDCQTRVLKYINLINNQ